MIGLQILCFCKLVDGDLLKIRYNAKTLTLENKKVRVGYRRRPDKLKPTLDFSGMNIFRSAVPTMKGATRDNEPKPSST